MTKLIDLKWLKKIQALYKGIPNYFRDQKN